VILKKRTNLDTVVQEIETRFRVEQLKRPGLSCFEPIKRAIKSIKVFELKIAAKSFSERIYHSKVKYSISYILYDAI
jgi:hypothetical protein